MPTPINISASRGAAILGLSSWTTQIQAWLQIKESRYPGFCEKHNYELPVVEYSPAMQWGHAFESAIIELAERKQNMEIEFREFFFGFHTHAQNGNGKFPRNDPFLMASFDKRDLSDYVNITCHIDGQYDNNWGKGDLSIPLILHEGKTTSIFYFNDNFGEPGTDQVPIEYQIQCQHQMICTGAEKVILSVLVFPRRVEDWVEMGWEVMKLKEFDNEYFLFYKNKQYSTIFHWASALGEMGYFHQYEITANKELQDLMIQHYTDFWNKYIIGDEEPKPCTYDDIKLLCREPVGTIIADEKIERLKAEYKMITKEIGKSGTLSKRLEKIKTDILNYMRENDKTIDTDTEKKWILRDRTGNKIASFNGNMFR